MVTWQRSAGLSALAAMALVLGAQQGRPFFRDKQGRFAVYNVSSGSTEFQPGGIIEIDWSGQPINGFSRDQGLTFATRRLTGRLSQAQDGTVRILDGQTSGASVFSVERQGSTSKIASETVRLSDDGQVAIVTIPGTLTFTNDFQGQGRRRSLQLKAAGGRVTFDPLALTSADPLRSANLSGPVTARLVTDSATAAGTDKSVVNLRGAALTYDRTSRTLTATGNVVVEGEQSPASGTGFQGVMTVDRVDVVFNASYEVLRIRTSSGQGNFQDKPGG